MSMSFRACATLAALLISGAHLGWESLNGGIASHHLLANPDLPAISNGWGLLTLPLLTWFLSGTIQTRWTKGRRSVVLAFGGALVYGAALMFAFWSGSETVPFYLLLGMLALALLLPLYRGEFVLGWVIGSMLAFGAILPLLFAAVIGGISALAHCVIYPLFRRFARAS
jgi:hypothetical protein